jgi:hypothetical protein
MNLEQIATRFEELVEKVYRTEGSSQGDVQELESLTEKIEDAGYEGFLNGEQNPFLQLTDLYVTWQSGYEQAERRDSEE